MLNSPLASVVAVVAPIFTATSGNGRRQKSITLPCTSCDGGGVALLLAVTLGCAMPLAVGGAEPSGAVVGVVGAPPASSSGAGAVAVTVALCGVVGSVVGVPAVGPGLVVTAGWVGFPAVAVVVAVLVAVGVLCPPASACS
jgi:hypothetical protein